MKIVVTGGAGKIGICGIASLQAAGHSVVVFDLKPHPTARSVIVDCTDFGQVLGALSGIDAIGGALDAVVHLAGIPAPSLAPDHVTFEANTVSTYNVFSAAARLGIKRVVWGSSETIHGLPFKIPPDFVPIDESHPPRAEWSYALSKVLGETMADNFVRWHPEMTIVSLRFSNVFAADDYALLPAIQADEGQRKINLWSYVDAADAGDACQLAVDAPLSGHERMLIAAGNTLLEVPTAALMKAYFPDVPIRAPLEGCVALLSSARARELIGYHPRRSWRNQCR